MPQRFRWALLLAASAYFYMCFIPYYILILLFTIIVDYFAGILIARSSGKKRKAYLVYSIVANVSVLAFFKYFNFAAWNLQALAHAIGWNYSLPALAIVLPIGLSFHTFQSMSYTIEVYRGRQQPERHFGIFALYVLFFPQLVAGPIERPQNLLHQFHERHDFDYARVVSGLRLMLWGFIQKMVIADRLAPIVNKVYADPDHHSGVSLAIATALFAFQILCDFAGYSDIAIGSARVLGFKLMQNFRQPYLAQSVTEFWKRWHISLSSWFRDYLYVPLGGNRVGHLRRYLNVMVVFMISGLWHGADWRFVAWGTLNGIFVVLEDQPALGRLGARHRSGGVAGALRVVVTFSMICLTWVFFRAQSATQAVAMIGKMARGLLSLSPGELGAAPLVLALLLVVVLLVMAIAREKVNLGGLIDAQPAWIRWPLYAGAVSGVLLFGVLLPTDFIYFQF